MDHDDRIKLNVFQAPTTYQAEYPRYTNLDKREKYVWPKERYERPEKPSRPFEPIDPENFIKWKSGTHVPFTLFIKPRPIIDTKPSDIYPRYSQTIDKGKDEAMKTRPRLYQSPAVRMDDIPDPEMRKLMCSHMYTTEWSKAVKEGAGLQTKRIMPQSTLEPKADQVSRAPELEEPIAPGCREIAKDWDVKQRRACVNPTKTFWAYKDPAFKRGACENPYKGLVSQETKDEIAGLIQKDKLRLIHDTPCSSYAGYKPRIVSVPPSKVDLPVTHPFLSTSQAVTQRYAADQLSNKTS